MKLLLVLGSDDNYDIISEHIHSLGFALIRYRHVLKAIDNIDEIDPSGIIVSARDFPRHWKILVQCVRSERSKESCPIIILKGNSFNTEETSKAFFLGANGVISDTLNNQEDINRLRNILGRQSSRGSPVPERENQQHRHFSVEPWHRAGLLIANFTGKSIVAADVKTISAMGLSCTPVKPLPPKAAKVNKELSECSLRIGDAILSPVCRISAAGKTILLKFVSFPDGEQHILDRYLEEFHTQNEMVPAV